MEVRWGQFVEYRPQRNNRHGTLKTSRRVVEVNSRTVRVCQSDTNWLIQILLRPKSHNRQAERQTDRQREPERQTDKESLRDQGTKRHRDRETERERERDRETSELDIAIVQPW